MATQPAPRSKNKQLSEYNRNALYQHAKTLVTESEDRSALDAAYTAASAAVRHTVEAKFPPRDMKVLLKYEAARRDECVYLSRGTGDYDQFCFRRGEEGPLRPKVGNCRNHTYLLEGDAVGAVDTFVAAQKAYDAAIADRLADYKALIFSVRTFNEVVNVWPEAEQLREAIVGSATALTVLNNDVVARIQRDAAQRLAA